MSQVSAMISATLSNVVDIRPALFGHGEDGRRPRPGACSPPVPGPLKTRTPRIAKDAGKFNGGGRAAKSRQRLEISPCAGYRIATGAAAFVALFGLIKGANIAPAPVRPDYTGTYSGTYTGTYTRHSRQREGTHALRAPAP